MTKKKGRWERLWGFVATPPKVIVLEVLTGAREGLKERGRNRFIVINNKNVPSMWTGIKRKSKIPFPLWNEIKN